MDAVPLDWLRAVYDDWARGDFRAGADRLAPDFEFSMTQDFPEPVSGVRPDELRDAWRGFLGSWSHVRMESEEIVAAGDRALVHVVQTGTGRTSGVETSMRYFHVWRFRDGRTLRLKMLMDEGAAHVDQLRGLYDAWGRGDFDAGADLFDPDFEFITSEGFPDAPASGEGIERVERWRDEFLAAFQELRIEVLARVRQRGRFRATGIDVDITYFHLWTFRGGRVVRFQAFDPNAEVEARAAANP
jgi:ketosteroid isomerase-like protein